VKLNTGYLKISHHNKKRKKEKKQWRKQLEFNVPSENSFHIRKTPKEKSEKGILKEIKVEHFLKFFFFFF
jgi:hypothetical protein